MSAFYHVSIRVQKVFLLRNRSTDNLVQSLTDVTRRTSRHKLTQRVTRIPELLDPVAQRPKTHTQKLRGRGLVIPRLLQGPDDSVPLDVRELAPEGGRTIGQDILRGCSSRIRCWRPCGCPRATWSGVIIPPPLKVSARSSTFSSSRTLPGKG